MNIIGRNAEISKFASILEGWNRNSPLWVHFQGEPGSGKSHLIHFLLENKLKSFDLLYWFNNKLCSIDISTQIWEIFYYIYRNFPMDAEAFLSKYPGYLKTVIWTLFKNESDRDKFRTYSIHFFSELLLQLFRFLSFRRETVFVLENINFEDNNLPSPRPNLGFAQAGHTDILFRLLNADSQLPILILTTGPENPSDGFSVNMIGMKKLSAVEIQEFIQNHFSIRGENARFIANHLQIKSQGNPRKIKFLLEAYYRDIIPPNSDKFIDAKKLQRLRISPIPEVIFKNLAGQLSETEISVFSFLSHLTDPLPLQVLQKILDKLTANRNLINTWFKKDYLSQEEFAGEKFILISWDEWKNYLRKSISINQTRKILEILRKNSFAKSDKFPLQLSDIYFDIGDVETALNLARSEVKILKKMGFAQRAYERYNFLKRNLSQYSGDRKSQGTILQEIGLLQKSLGLHENAFESFRELRDHFGKNDQQNWFYASLQMAEILLKMDALAEARYLLNDLKIKKAADAFTKSFSYMLLGDLEKNLGHEDYALTKYQQALSLVDDVDDAEFIYQLYSRIRTVYVQNNKREEIKSLISKVASAIVDESRFNFMIQFDLLKFYMEQKDIKSAVELSHQIYRKVKHRFDPGIMAQTILYLVDIYAFLSKWYLARSHLGYMMRTWLFITHSKIEVRILINLAVIEKEIAHYRDALKLLARAEKICREENLLHELNEIKIHMGHIQLLIHGYLRQREYLSDALRWSIVNQDHELFIMASLYMSSYEVQQKRLEEARKHLNEARTQINLSGNEIDKLNYMFYLIRYLLATEEFRWAEKVLQVWEIKSRGITKFENLVIWFKAKLHYKKGAYQKAMTEYQLSLERSRKYKLPHLEFHILKEMVVLCHQAGLEKELQKFTQPLQIAYENLLNAIADEILQKQFYESREVHELVEMGIALD